MDNVQPWELKESALQARILEELLDLKSQFTSFKRELSSTKRVLGRMDETMATLVQVANEVKEAVNARLDREIAKGQQALAEKQKQYDDLVASEDAEDVGQNAEIARLQAELVGQAEAVAVLESIKTGVNADLNGDGGMVVPDESQPEVPVVSEPVVSEPVVEQPAEPVAPQPVVEEPTPVVETPQTVVGDEVQAVEPAPVADTTTDATVVQ